MIQCSPWFNPMQKIFSSSRSFHKDYFLPRENAISTRAMPVPSGSPFICVLPSRSVIFPRPSHPLFSFEIKNGYPPRPGPHVSLHTGPPSLAFPPHYFPRQSSTAFFFGEKRLNCLSPLFSDSLWNLSPLGEFFRFLQECLTCRPLPLPYQ